MKQLRFILLGLIVLAIAVFGISNPYRISVNLFGKIVYTNLLVMVSVPFIAGFAVGVGFMVWQNLSNKPKTPKP